MTQNAAQIPCPLCGGRRVVTGTSGDMHWSFGVIASGADGFDAVICLSCGYTTLYAQNLDKLVKKVQKSEEKEAGKRRKL